ncbi:endoplasmic reticulum-Golgi intermediate compartment protein 3 [Arabidopsis lyrata subsp. lyrata]|nr:endoplasmic reticulum-Golgi intermediate compartment protein 3-like [Arabidopsis lyrata subsp. lyrata]XP_020872431.1 endoplasmic reticulum-Golgi intermediate compartment protein 3 [Arabidopsis lyrata subsp. lyrata]|eukprot:XP_020869737.1 endoplasmic reticulum-Golgi intermediate compartment protein 3-like [Arabidopsis lyrata subsp. lyrata]
MRTKSAVNRRFHHKSSITPNPNDSMYGSKFDIRFPALACSILSVDAMDISGELLCDVKHDIIKRRLDSNGNTLRGKT